MDGRQGKGEVKLGSSFSSAVWRAEEGRWVEGEVKLAQRWGKTLFAWTTHGSNCMGVCQSRKMHRQVAQSR